MNGYQIGILALQGDFELHQRRLEELGLTSVLVRREEELAGVAALILPGGESTTLLRLCTGGLRQALTDKIRGGMPVLATCAGAILLAKHVVNPEQDSLGLLDIEVSRNAYGRQVDSFIDTSLNWTTAGRKELEKLDAEAAKIHGSRTLEGVFIRAPKITKVGKAVHVLIERGLEPVLVREKSVFAATFHPELSEKAAIVQRLFIARIRG